MPSDYVTPAKLGHVHLKVADLDRAVAFYSDVLGFEVQVRGPQAAFLSSGGYHHHIALNTWDSAGGLPPEPDRTGLYHVAFLYPDRGSLGRAVQRVMDAGIRITGKADHGVSEAVYFNDPEGNGVELYRDRAEADWPRGPDGRIRLCNAPLDLRALLADATR
jgi:catechol 2,3-dioxygenase